MTQMTVGELKAQFSEVLEKVKKKLDERSDKDDNQEAEPVFEMEASSIEKIKKYIEANYTDSKLNLTSVAQTFGFSASYLSRKFKQETGKNFVEFLTECRMNAAMKLAQTNMKMFNASNEVGIPDPNYFGRCFKHSEGSSKTNCSIAGIYSL